jgi:hypothetical protein
MDITQAEPLRKNHLFAGAMRLHAQQVFDYHESLKKSKSEGDMPSFRPKDTRGAILTEPTYQR